MKVYIAGKITNNPDYIKQFAEAEEELKASGHTVLNPVKDKGFLYKDCIDMGLCELMKCDGIYMLDGWEDSRGARLEYLYASVTGMVIVEQRREKK
jgi:hypothetical protein